MTTQTQTTAEILASEGIKVYYSHAFKMGYGNAKIELSFDYKHAYKTFSAITTDIVSVESANKLESTEKHNAMLEIIYSQIEMDLFDWCTDIDHP